MKNSKDFMDEFMETWKNMIKYQNVKINPVEPNYAEIDIAFWIEKKIVHPQEYKEKQQISELDDDGS